MRALYYDGSGGVEWREDPEPDLADPHDALVRPIADTTCDPVSGRIDPEIVRTDLLPFETAAETLLGAGAKPVYVPSPAL